MLTAGVPLMLEGTVKKSLPYSTIGSSELKDCKEGTESMQVGERRMSTGSELYSEQNCLQSLSDFKKISLKF
jgi:hypothetical protein